MTATLMRVEGAAELATANARRAENALAWAEAFDVVDERTFLEGERHMHAINAEAKLQSGQRDRYLAPLKDLIATIKDDFDPPVKNLTKALATFKAKLSGYRTRMAALAEARRAEVQQALVAHAPPEVLRPLLVGVAETVAPKTKGTSYIDHWVVSVVDESKVPEAYWVRVIDRSALTAAVAAGAREIPGCEITNVPIVRCS